MKTTRRSFTKTLVSLGAVFSGEWRKLPFAEGAPSDLSEQKPGPPTSGFPAGSYTPFGYLDNPYHSWDLHPSGVLRSVPPVGMGLYFPAGPGGYFDYKKNSVYRSILRLGFRIGDRVLFEEDDFRAAGFKISALHHSKNLLRLDFAVSNLSISASFFLVGENTLACDLSLRNSGDSAQDVHAFAVQRMELGASSWWGRDGISGSFDEHGQHSILRSFAAGPVFVLKMDHPVDSHLVATDAALKAWMAGNGTSTPAATAYYPDSLNSALGLRASLPPGAKWTGKVLLSRAENERLPNGKSPLRRSVQSLFPRRKSPKTIDSGAALPAWTAISPSTGKTLGFMTSRRCE